MIVIDSRFHLLGPKQPNIICFYTHIRIHHAYTPKLDRQNTRNAKQTKVLKLNERYHNDRLLACCVNIP